MLSYAKSGCILANTRPHKLHLTGRWGMLSHAFRCLALSCTVVGDGECYAMHSGAWPYHAQLWVMGNAISCIQCSQVLGLIMHSCGRWGHETVTKVAQFTTGLIPRLSSGIEASLSFPVSLAGGNSVACLTHNSKKK